MSFFVRWVNWVLEPTIFLLIRLLADFVAAAYFLIIRDYWVGLWFGLVGIATLASDLKAKRHGRVETR